MAFPSICITDVTNWNFAPLPSPCSVVAILSCSGDAQIAGEDYTLTCQITGGGTISYRWFKDTILTDETSDTFSFSPLVEADSGDYTCEGTRSSTSSTVTSTSVTILVGKFAIILEQPI